MADVAQMHQQDASTSILIGRSSENPATDERPTQATAALSIEKHLESLTLGIIEGVNSRRFQAHPSYANLSPQWKGQSNDHAISYSLDQHFQITRQLTIDNPDLWIKVLGINTVMGYRDLCADVFVNLEHHGMPPGLVRTCIGVFHWKLCDEEDGRKRWFCMKHTGARGMTCIGGDGEM